jgi:hypothetical protein
VTHTRFGLLDRQFPLQFVGRDDRRLTGDHARRLVASQRLDFVSPHDASNTILTTALSDLMQVTRHLAA